MVYDPLSVLGWQPFESPVGSFMTGEFLGNSGQDYAIALAIVVLGVFATAVFKGFVLARLRSISAKTGTDLDDVIIMSLSSVHWPPVPRCPALHRPEVSSAS